MDVDFLQSCLCAMLTPTAPLAHVRLQHQEDVLRGYLTGHRRREVSFK